MRTYTSAPVYVSWNYTYACNLNCSHCYSRAASYPKELDTTGYFKIVDQLIQASVFKVGLGGGEPLIRKDCLRVIERMAAAGIETNITSNGWFIDARLAKKMADAQLNVLYVSVDSAVEADHDRFRRANGSFQRAVRAIRNAADAGVAVKLSTVLSQLNADTLDGIVEIAEREGARGIEFKRFRPAGNGMLSKQEWALQEEQEAKLKSDIARFKAASKVDIALIYGSDPDGDTDSGCPCGIKSICIRPNGDVSPCAYGETVIGNLTVNTLAKLWRDSPMLALMRQGSGCSALKNQPSPSNPYLSESQMLPVLN
jgi:MoaA/NifB/PqqE/SkfB family radical SAM enzyme